MKIAWLNITTEADQLAEIHGELQIRLANQVQGNVQKWKAANYHKSMLSWKETKNAEEGFSKAQKPWTKRQEEGIHVFYSHLVIIPENHLKILFNIMYNSQVGTAWVCTVSLISQNNSHLHVTQVVQLNWIHGTVYIVP